MGKILGEIPSSSDPRKRYRIIEGDDGVVYCDCWAWKMNKKCKHLDIWNRKAYQSEVEVEEDEPCCDDTDHGKLISKMSKRLG